MVLLGRARGPRRTGTGPSRNHLGRRWFQTSSNQRRLQSTFSFAAAAQALGLNVTDVETLCPDPMDAEMVERARVQ